jgi:hypothetical protein
MSAVYRGRTLAMKPARVVLTRHPMARPLSAPFDTERQRHVLGKALGLLESATEPCTVLEVPEKYRVAPNS